MAQNAYINLARKYRPQTILELIGQDVLVKSLENAFTLNKIAHAFMLTGVRGVGKTTTARIIAKALNCIGIEGNGSPTLNPCGVCENCTLITADRHLDVIEIDAASNTGVDNIREVIENSMYKPTVARYKVFIIDEIHMLSKNAFNALLKTLEEPPQHLKFIFATTEIKKVPITVLSRCQRFDLKMVEGLELEDHLKKICNAENIAYEEDAIVLIAKAAQGSVRDSLSLLDRAIVFSNNNLQTDIIIEMLGYSKSGVIAELFELLIENNANKVLEIFNNLRKEGMLAESFLEDLMNVCNDATVVLTTNSTDLLNSSKIYEQQIESLAKKTNLTFFIATWQVLLQSLDELKKTNNAYQVCYFALLKILNLHNLINIDNLINDFSNAHNSNMLNSTTDGSDNIEGEFLNNFPQAKKI
jgi:DNA polymerase-3 subunit gamma/tau